MTLVDERAEGPVEVAERPARAADPVSVAVHLRAREERGLDQRFGPSDPPRGWDVARFPASRGCFEAGSSSSC